MAVTANIIGVTADCTNKGVTTFRVNFLIDTDGENGVAGTIAALKSIRKNKVPGLDAFFVSASVSPSEEVRDLFTGSATYSSEIAAVDAEKPGGPAGEPSATADKATNDTTTQFSQEMTPVPVFNSCGDPMGPVEVSKSVMTVVTKEIVPVSDEEFQTGFGENTAAANDANGKIDREAAVDAGFGNWAEDPPPGLITTGTSLGPITATPWGKTREKVTHKKLGTGTIEVENVAYDECSGGADCKRKAIMITDCETGEKYPTAVPVKPPGGPDTITVVVHEEV